MPYIVIKSSHGEIDRRELTAKVVIGRAPECDVTVKDILLSRRHCRVEETVEGWCLIDLGSKNGTSINGQRVPEWQVLSDGDVVSLGQTRIVFHTGVPGEDVVTRLMSPSRPVDPHEALAGTLSGFELLVPGEGEVDEAMPCPQPAPILPGAFDREELHSLLTAIASSSWDSIYAEARQRVRKNNRPAKDEPRKRRSRPRSPIDLSLQVSSPKTSESDLVDLDDPSQESLVLAEHSGGDGAGQAVPWDSMAGEARFGEAMARESMSGDSISGESVFGESPAGESFAGESVAGDSVAGLPGFGDSSGDSFADSSVDGVPFDEREFDAAANAAPAESRPTPAGTQPRRGGFWSRLRFGRGGASPQSQSRQVRGKMRWIAVALWLAVGGLLLTHWLSLMDVFTPDRIAASPAPGQQINPQIPGAAPQPTIASLNPLAPEPDPTLTNPPAGANAIPTEALPANQPMDIGPTAAPTTSTPTPADPAASDVTASDKAKVPSLIDLQPALFPPFIFQSATTMPAGSFDAPIKSIIPGELPIPDLLRLPATMQEIDLPTLADPAPR
jgi:predicted component of type VI protein secretion system